VPKVNCTWLDKADCLKGSLFVESLPSVIAVIVQWLCTHRIRQGTKY